MGTRRRCGITGHFGMRNAFQRERRAELIAPVASGIGGVSVVPRGVFVGRVGA